MTSKPTSPSVLKILSCIHCIDNWINDVLHTFDGTQSSQLWLNELTTMNVCFIREFSNYMIFWGTFDTKERTSYNTIFGTTWGLTWFSWVIIKYNEIWRSFSQHSSNLKWLSMQYIYTLVSFIFSMHIIFQLVMIKNNLFVPCALPRNAVAFGNAVLQKITCWNWQISIRDKPKLSFSPPCSSSARTTTIFPSRLTIINGVTP